MFPQWLSQDSNHCSMPWPHHFSLCCWPVSCNLMSCSKATHTTLTIISGLLFVTADDAFILQVDPTAKLPETYYFHAMCFQVPHRHYLGICINNKNCRTGTESVKPPQCIQKSLQRPSSLLSQGCWSRFLLLDGLFWDHKVHHRTFHKFFKPPHITQFTNMSSGLNGRQAFIRKKYLMSR